MTGGGTVVVIGAGPAGMSCANALLSFSLVPVVIERAARVGGIQRANFHPNLWMLGMPGETGQEISERLARHYFQLPLVTHLDSRILAVGRAGGGFRVAIGTPAGGTEIAAAAIVLATGTDPRSTPELEALRRVSGRVIVGPLAEIIRDGIRAGRALILGGGDNALDHALYLAERGNRVTVCARRGFTARLQFRQACREHPGIELREGCVPARLAADAAGVTVNWADGRRESYDWLLAMYGYDPNTAVLDRFAPDLRPVLTGSGHLRVDAGQRTSVPGLYAAGDITEPLQPSVPIAIAQGLTAARAIERDLHAPS